MPTARPIPQPLTSRLRGPNLPRWFAAARLAGLVLLFLLPVQMRAGASDPHPHAMLQLLLDARDGHIDHHNQDVHAVAHDHQGGAGAQELDVPTTGSSYIAAGAMAMLAAFVTAPFIPTARRVASWPRPVRPPGWTPALDPPPPRAAAD